MTLCAHKRMLLIGCSLTLISGCGSEKSSNEMSSSGGNPIISYPTTSNMAECNRANLTGIPFAGQVGTYYDPITRLLRQDFVNLNVETIPDSLYTSQSYQIQFFRWSSKKSGYRQTNQVPIRFFFVDKLTGASTINGTVDKLSKTTMDEARNFFGAAWSNVPVKDFFRRTMIVLTGLDFQYDAVTVALYNSSFGSAAIAQGDVLLPPFEANPALYKNAKPVTELYLLHPHYSYLSSNADENDYARLTDDICRALAGINDRIPASLAKPMATETNFLSQIWRRIVGFFSDIF